MDSSIWSLTTKGVNVELWYNWGDGFDPTLQLSWAWLVGLADGDGDGDVDLLVSETRSQVVLWINDGYDFVRGEEFVLDSEEVHFAHLPAGQPPAKPPACCGTAHGRRAPIN